jgi:hypothetical protein
MAVSKKRAVPRTFFLNETHELAPGAKSGRGSLPKYAEIAWAAKAEHIHQSLQTVLQKIESSSDPLKEERYFVLAQPVPEIEKLSKDEKKAPQGTYKEKTEFGGQHGRVFDRLGLDLLQITEDGKAVVHAKKEKIEQLLQRSAALESLGRREQSRWATIESFETIPLQLRVDADWLRSLKHDQPADVVIELQPVLTRVEADRVLRSIAEILLKGGTEKLTGTGTDFSGRHWFRGKATQRSIRSIAKDFFSVQSLHAPLYSIAAGRARSGGTRSPLDDPEPATPSDAIALPCVAVVDLGVPTDHRRLRAYRRGQFYPQDAPRAPVGDHGSFVASRIVFGDCDSPDQLASTIGRCSFYDAMVGDYPAGADENDRVNDKIVMEAIRGVRGAAPDVRVFNLSIGSTRPLHSFSAVDRREKRLSLQDLDNFVFASDSLVVVAAGNSQKGIAPNPEYPDHYEDERWALGAWACGFNTLVCGSYVSKLSTDGLAQGVGWPSPFTRVGPGICEAPVPSFSAEGGNTDDGYNWRSGLGVWGFSGSGLPEDRIGTSHAAPILAREAAFALHELQRFCAPGTQPFGVAARAFLALTASQPVSADGLKALADRTLGYGKARSGRLNSPEAGSAIILWQGHIESPSDIVRVQLPIPLDWLAEANDPVLRLIVCYDSPVNEAANETWACRKVSPILHLGPDAASVRAPSGGHGSYPIIDRRYKLNRFKPDGEKAAEGDMWLLELSYDEIAPYPSAMDFDPRQRVAFVAQLFDHGEEPIDPQSAMQALPITASMSRLSIQPTAIRSPIIIRTRTS